MTICIHHRNQEPKRFFFMIMMTLLLFLLSSNDHQVLGRQSPTSNNNSNDLYKILGISKTASPNEIKKAYHQLALKNHPDKVPTSERKMAEKKFKRIAEAYETLSDTKKRKLYDQYGTASLDPTFHPTFNNNNNNHNNPFSGTQTFFFGGTPPPSSGNFGGFPRSSLFGNGGSGNQEGFTFDLGDILEEIMRGPSSSQQKRQQQQPTFSRRPGGGSNNKRRADFGNNQSGRNKNPHSTTTLPAKTQVVWCSLEDLMLGKTKQIRVKIPSSSSLSSSSNNNNIIEQIYTIHLKPGWKEGTKIKFPSSSKFPPIIFIIQQRKHSYLSRMNNDLYWKNCIISKYQSKHGAKLKLPLPDGELLEVITTTDQKKKNSIVSGDTMTIKGKGMPIRRNNNRDGNRNGDDDGECKRGDLIISFVVKD